MERGSRSRRIVPVLGCLLAVATTAGCGILGIDDEEVRTLEVAAHKGTCYGLEATLCLQVREPGEASFQNLFETPRGFDYEWGFEYLITVEERRVENPPADGSSVERILRRVLAREPVEPGTTFELALTGGEGIRAVEAGLYTLFEGPEELACATAGPMCGTLAGLVAEGARVGVTLSHPAVRGDPFPIEAWAECDAPAGPC